MDWCTCGALKVPFPHVSRVRREADPHGRLPIPGAGRPTLIIDDAPVPKDQVPRHGVSPSTGCRAHTLNMRTNPVLCPRYLLVDLEPA